MLITLKLNILVAYSLFHFVISKFSKIDNIQN